MGVALHGGVARNRNSEVLFDGHPPALLSRGDVTQDTVITNAQIVTAREVFVGSVTVRNGRISDVDTGRSFLPSAIDLEGDFLLPGLIDVHTDNLERHLEPRPGVVWPNLAAMIAHDRQVAAAGITTVLDALCVGDSNDGDSVRDDALVLALQAMEQAQADGLLKSEHFLHLRCEVSSPDVVRSFEGFVSNPLVKLVSVMDHTPGQRQWSDLDKWRLYNSTRKLTETQIGEIMAKRLRLQEEHAHANRRAIVGICREQKRVLASHDDTTADHVAQAVADGVAISEFPTTEEAAALARREGMWVIMGGPNVVLGGSHSGNVSARLLIDRGLVDGLASDYVPVSLVQACFLTHDVLHVPLDEAVATVSAKPAAMVGLTDRGEIAVGKRADMIRVTRFRAIPTVRNVWRQGCIVA